MNQASTQTRNNLAVQNITIVRGYRPLIEGLSFRLEAGRVMHMHGSNGCGKTSLLYVLTGMRRAETGAVMWAGRDIHADLPGYRRNLCFIGHENAIKLELTVRENLEQFYYWQNCLPLAPAEVLSTIGLSGYEDVPCHQLSAGQRRKLSLSRLLLSKAVLWILDEPFTALDQASIDYFQALITRHVQGDGMVILTSHQAVDWQQCQVTDLSLTEVAA